MRIFTLKVTSLIVMIIGACFFIFSMAYSSEVLLLISLTQLMAGSCSFFVLDNIPKSPILFKKEKRLTKK